MTVIKRAKKQGYKKQYFREPVPRSLCVYNYGVATELNFWNTCKGCMFAESNGVIEESLQEQLTIFGFSGCRMVTDIPLLTHAGLINCVGCPNLASISSMPNLASLDCRDCQQLTFLPYLPRLSTLHIADCCLLMTWKDSAENLREFACSNCPLLHLRLPLYFRCNQKAGMFFAFNEPRSRNGMAIKIQSAFFNAKIKYIEKIQKP